MVILKNRVFELPELSQLGRDRNKPVCPLADRDQMDLGYKIVDFLTFMLYQELTPDASITTPFTNLAEVHMAKSSK